MHYLSFLKQACPNALNLKKPNVNMKYISYNFGKEFFLKGGSKYKNIKPNSEINEIDCKN